MFGFEVGYFAQAESLYDDILQDREPVINRRTRLEDSETLGHQQMHLRLQDQPQ